MYSSQGFSLCFATRTSQLQPSLMLLLMAPLTLPFSNVKLLILKHMNRWSTGQQRPLV